MSFNLPSVLSKTSKQKALCAGGRPAELGGSPSLEGGQVPAARTRTPEPLPGTPQPAPRTQLSAGTAGGAGSGQAERLALRPSGSRPTDPQSLCRRAQSLNAERLNVRAVGEAASDPGHAAAKGASEEEPLC